MNENHKEAIDETSKGSMGTLSLIFGIAGIFFITIPVVSLSLGVVGLILSMASVRDSNKKNRKPGVATAGIITSVIAIVLAVLVVVIPIMYAGMQQRVEQSTEQTQ